MSLRLNDNVNLSIYILMLLLIYEYENMSMVSWGIVSSSVCCVLPWVLFSLLKKGFSLPTSKNFSMFFIQGSFFSPFVLHLSPSLSLDFTCFYIYRMLYPNHANAFETLILLIWLGNCGWIGWRGPCQVLAKCRHSSRQKPWWGTKQIIRNNYRKKDVE